VTVPQSYGLGDEAEVDCGLFGGHIAGVLEPLWMFCMRLSASGRGYHEAFGNQAIESFLEGHVHAFDISGVCRRPHRFGSVHHPRQRQLVALEYRPFGRRRIFPSPQQL
jgi:hypothetical protein